MTSPRIIYTPRPDATPEAELSTLADVYKFVLDCHAKQEAAPDSRPDDAERSLSDGASDIIQDSE
jgi:hypothetical protein